MTKLDRKFDPVPGIVCFVKNCVKSFKGQDALTNKSADHLTCVFFIQIKFR